MKQPRGAVLHSARAAVLAAALLLPRAPLAAQQPGAIEGTVTAAATGAPLPGAQVTLVGTLRGAFADEAGHFRLGSLAPGRYVLEVGDIGHATLRREVTLAAGQTARLELALERGPVLLSGVVVTATRTPIAAAQVTSQLDVIGREQVRTSPARTVSDMLHEVPAVELPRTSGTVSGAEQIVAIRGTDEGRTLVLADGVPLNDPWGEWVDWPLVPKSMVNQVEILEGDASSLYGTNAMGGVIQLVTRPITPRSLWAQLSGGSRGMADASVVASDIRGRLAIAADARVNAGGGYTLLSSAQQGPIDTRSHATERNAGVRGEYTLAADRSLRFGASVLDEDRDLGTPFSTSSRQIYTARAGATAGGADGGQARLDLFGVVERYDSHQSAANPERTLESRISDQSIPSDELGGTLQWNRALPARSALVLGGDFRLVHGRMYEDVYQGSSIAGTRTAGGSQLLGGAFAQVLLAPVEALRIQGAVRVDGWRTYNGSLTDLQGAVTAEPTRGDAALSPSLGVRWAIGGGLALRGSVYRGFRAPTLSEQYRTFHSGPLAFHGNPDLGPEHLTGYDAGFNWAPIPAVNVRATYFQNDLRDLATFVFQGNNTLMRENVGRTRSRGGEGELAVQLTDALRLTGAYAYDDAKITGDANPANVGLRVARVPLHQASARLTYDAPRHGSYAVTYRHEGWSSTISKAALAPYDVLGLHAGYPVMRGLDLSLDVQNATDESYLVNLAGPLEYQGLPRTISVGVTYTGR